MGLASGNGTKERFRGIFRKGVWAFVERPCGARDILTRAQYDAMAIDPPYDRLRTEEEFHEDVLAHRPGEPL
jgi:hypothetical protein